MITQTRRRHVVVGVDGSPQSLAALRQAVSQARCRSAELQVVYAREPVKVTDATPLADGDLAPAGARNAAAEQQARYEAFARDEEGRALISAALRHAVGGTPRDIAVIPVVAVGKPGPALVAHAWSDDDLLVLGTGGGRRWRHIRRSSVSRYCARHAGCPVLVVPSDDSPDAATVDGRYADHRHHVEGQAEPAELAGV